MGLRPPWQAIKEGSTSSTAFNMTGAVRDNAGLDHSFTEGANGEWSMPVTDGRHFYSWGTKQGAPSPLRQS